MMASIVFFVVGLCFYQCSAEQLSEPSRPTNLRVTNISSGSLRLSWDPPTNNGGAPIFEYKLWTQRGGSRRAWDEGERLLVSDYTTNLDGTKSYVENFNSTTWLITGLARDTLYRFMVSARNSKSTYGPPSLESAEVRTLLTTANFTKTKPKGNRLYRMILTLKAMVARYLSLIKGPYTSFDHSLNTTMPP